MKEETTTYNFTYYYSDGSFHTFTKEIPVSVAKYIDTLQAQMKQMIQATEDEDRYNALFLDLLDESRLN